jgi:serine phosphatase RsbU (regulator of sigma subunit)/PAS domain-containing protein
MGHRVRGASSDGGRREVVRLGAGVVVLLVLAAVTALSSAVLVSTLGIVVVVGGLVLRPRAVLVLAAVAVGLAVLLVLTGSVPDSGWLRVGNVVIGSALGFSTATALAVRVRQVRRLQRRDAALLAGLPDAVVGLNAAGTVTYANPAAHALLGPAVDSAPAGLRHLLEHGTGHADELALPHRELRVDWTAVTLDDDHDAPSTLLLVRDAAPRLAALEQAAQLAETRREAALQRHYLDVLERALRPPLPTVPGLDLGAAYVSAEEGAPAGGDLHDAVVLPDGCLYLLVLDALGHGVASTRHALRLVHAARVLIMNGVGVADLAARLDSALERPDRVMASLVAVLLDPASGRLEAAAAGHPPALIVRGDGGTSWLESSGRGVGTPSAGTDRTATALLEPGDTLLLYTDGLVEAHRDLITGMDRLPEVARALRTHPAAALARRTADLMLDGATRRDDALVVAVRRPG